MSAINGFKIIGYCYQDTQIKITDNSQKIAYCILNTLTNENKRIPIIAFNDMAVKLDYLGKKGNAIQVTGTINTKTKIEGNSTYLLVELIALEINLINFKKRVKLSDRDFSDLFKLYDLPKYIPPIRK